jgi:DNA modification methylase
MPVAKRTEAGPYWRSDCGRAEVWVGDCTKVVAGMEPRRFHAVVTDPPYEFGSVPATTMGHNWDATGVAFDPLTWTVVLGACRPGAHMLSFGGTRVFHRMACAIEDSGFEIRDMVMWVYSSGYPKGRDIGKGIDSMRGADREVVGTRIMPDTTKVRPGFTGSAHSGAAAGAVREVNITVPATDEAVKWDGWNTTLKPAWEPIVMSRRPPSGTAAHNTLEWECGGINVRGCRVDPGGKDLWPANVIHDGADEQLCRYFYCAKAGTDSMNRPHGAGATEHPTVKPIDLMRYLVRLVCPLGGEVLDPFMGSGSTGVAALAEGVRFAGVEQSAEYADIAVGRLRLALQSAPDLQEKNTARRPAPEAPPPSWTG